MGCVVVVVAAIVADEPYAVGVAGARGAEPPAGGRSVQFCNALVVGGRAGPRLKIGQLRTVYREVGVVAGRPAYFVTGQQEDFAGQAVRATLVSAARTAVLAVRDLDLLDSVLDVAVKQVQERTVEITVNRAAFQLVHIRAVPLALFVDVLHQQPSTVARVVVQRTRFTLMDNNKFFG